MEQNCRMELQYDGTGLHGWAKQEGLPTVEGYLEAALRTVLGSAPAMQAAGRTDAGVHARRQFVSLVLPAGTAVSRLQDSLNALTPPGIVVIRIVPSRKEFDAREDATSRIYRYFLATSPTASAFWHRYCWQTKDKVDINALEVAASATEGRHDFTAFTPAETEHVFFGRSVLRCVWKRTRNTLSGRGDMLCLEIEAEAFLRHMVRILVGTMLEVAAGKRSPSAYRTLLEGAPRETAGPTAPAHGLFLWDVRYGSGKRAGISSKRRVSTASISTTRSAGPS